MKKPHRQLLLGNSIETHKREFEGRFPAMLDNSGPSSNGSKTKTLQCQVCQIYIGVLREVMEVLQIIQTLAIPLGCPSECFYKTLLQKALHMSYVGNREMKVEHSS